MNAKKTGPRRISAAEVDEQAPNFNESAAKHAVTKTRLWIAVGVLSGAAILLLIGFGMLYCLDIAIEQKREILSNIFTSLFNVVT